MKISKNVQRRTMIFAVATAILALFHAMVMGVQLFYSTNPYEGVDNYTYIGNLDTEYNVLPFEDGYDKYAITLEKDADGKPLVEALPSEMVIFSSREDYTRPAHYGWMVNRVVVYAALVMFVALIILLGWLLVSVIRGFNTGNIFQQHHSRMLRWLAVVTFVYYLLIENQEVFRMLAVRDLYGDASPIDLFGYASVGTECLLAPLLLLIFAELMAVAARINEEESMTI